MISPKAQDDNIQNGVVEDAVSAEAPGDPVLRNAAETSREVEFYSDEYMARHRADS